MIYGFYATGFSQLQRCYYRNSKRHLEYYGVYDHVTELRFICVDVLNSELMAALVIL